MTLLRSGVIAGIFGIALVLSDAEAQHGLDHQHGSIGVIDGLQTSCESASISHHELLARICYNPPASLGSDAGGASGRPSGGRRAAGPAEFGIIELSSSASISGIRVAPGAYSIYAVPAEDEWTLIVNGATSQWGRGSGYTDALRAREVGRIVLPVLPALDGSEPPEAFAVQFQPAGSMAVVMRIEWEDSVVYVPILMKHIGAIMPTG